MGGAYMLGLAVLGVPFGTLIDRHHKHRLMMVSAGVTVVAYCLATVVFFLAPDLSNPSQFWFWLFIGLVLLGGMVELIRNLALSTCVTILIPSEKRANANGLVGTVQGASMLVTSIFSGLAIGQLGLGWTLIISFIALGLSIVHLAFIKIPEPKIVHAEGTPSAVDFKGAWAAVIAVPGLLALIFYSTFNNLLGGVFMGLLDPYGLELMSVEAWGIMFGVCGIGFIIGGAIIASRGLGSRPLRLLLLANLGMWFIAATFALRASIVLLAVGMVLYMAIVPIIEAGEQTLLQRVVPLAKQGRVFGFAQAVEVSAAPISAFIVGPIAEFWIIPYGRSERGQQQLGWLVGDGPGRGIALVFIAAAVIGLITTLLVFGSRSYRVLSETYAAGDVNADVVPGDAETEAKSDDDPAANPPQEHEE